MRRGGPNYEQGLRLMRELGQRLGVPIEVYGPETHMTRIVPLALGGESNEQERLRSLRPRYKAFVYGYQTNAIQRMLDFDYICKRESPSISAIINPSRAGIHKAFWGTKEIILPMYKTISLAAKAYPEADVMVNFASAPLRLRDHHGGAGSRNHSDRGRDRRGRAREAVQRHGRHGQEAGQVVIGPATVGGMTAGAFRIGNTAGTIENIIASKLYRPGSVGFVSKSGGMLNEAFNIISRNSDGIYEGVAIGGDRYPGSTMLDHILRYETNPAIKMIACLGELGGEDEYRIIQALKEGKITKPLVAWVTGTCSPVLPASVQFGHAGAKADSQKETAQAKNEAFREAGAMCPSLSMTMARRCARSTRCCSPRAVVHAVRGAEAPRSPRTTAKR